MPRRWIWAVLPFVALAATADARAPMRPAPALVDQPLPLEARPDSGLDLFGDDLAIALGGPAAAEHPLLAGQITLPTDRAATAGPLSSLRARPDPRRGAVKSQAARPSFIAQLPEPATWAMLIVGFGAIGALVRRRFRLSEERFNERIRRITSGELD
jgi:hypothetical protein